MAQHPKILVTSAAGQTGIPLVLELRRRGYPVRALVRRRDHRARLLEDAGAEVVTGNAYALADMEIAMRGCQRAYCCPPTASNGLHFANVFAAAADANRPEHVVYLGQWLAHADHPSHMTRESYLGERLINRLPGISSTIVAPGWFAANYFMGLEMAAGLGSFMAPLGPGEALADVPPSNEDIAAVAAGALTRPEDHAGRFYRPTGPETVSPERVAAAMGAALGRKVRYVDASPAMFLRALRVLRPANFSDIMLTQLALYAEEYRRGAFAHGGPTDAVAEVGGRVPETIEQIARRAVSARGPLPGPASALGKLARIALTRAPDLARIEKAAAHVNLPDGFFAGESPAWLARVARAHPPAAAAA